MRKLDAAVCLVLVGSVGMFATSKSFNCNHLASGLTLAGLSLGIRQDDVVSRFGKYRRDADGNWTYQNGNGLLILEWAVSDPDGGSAPQLSTIKATGPAELRLNGKELPEFGATRNEISKTLGPPGRFLQDAPPTLEPMPHSDYCYRWDGQMVIYEFDKDRAITVEIRPDISLPSIPGDKHASTGFPVCSSATAG